MWPRGAWLDVLLASLSLLLPRGAETPPLLRWIRLTYPSTRTGRTDDDGGSDRRLPWFVSAAPTNVRRSGAVVASASESWTRERDPATTAPTTMNVNAQTALFWQREFIFAYTWDQWRISFEHNFPAVAKRQLRRPLSEFNRVLRLSVSHWIVSKHANTVTITITQLLRRFVPLSVNAAHVFSSPERDLNAIYRRLRARGATGRLCCLPTFHTVINSMKHAH